MMEVSFVVYGKPQAKQRPRVVYGHTYTPKETVAYENLVRLEYENQCGNIRFEQPLCMKLDIYYETPTSWSNKKKKMAVDGDIKKSTKPDLDNLIKTICDALNGRAYDDDAKVVCVYAEKKYGDSPRVEVLLSNNE